MANLKITYEPEVHKPVGVLLRSCNPSIIPSRVARPGGGAVIYVTVPDTDGDRAIEALNDAGFDVELTH